MKSRRRVYSTAVSCWLPAIRHRRGAIAMIFALCLIPLIGLIGLAIDFATWNQAHAMLTRAANTAALNAVKTAANGELAADGNFKTEGITSGEQWFASQIGSTSLPVSQTSLTVDITAGASVSATVTYTGTIPSVFGKLFNAFSYPLNVTAVATVSASPYVNVELLLDNSSSMQIGATYSDISILQQITACSTPFTSASGDQYGAILNGSVTQGSTAFSGYGCKFGNAYTGGDGINGLKCYQPVTVTPSPFAAVGLTPTTPPTLVALPPNGDLFAMSGSGPACTAIPNTTANAPCAFACHDDNSKPAGTGSDYFAIARRTIGSANAVKLRIDVLKNAVDQTIQTMESKNTNLSNINVGIFTFTSQLAQVYPSSGEAGNDFPAALAAVGSPPTAPNQAETGIQPSYHPNSVGDTDFPTSMTQLAAKLSPAGDGSTSGAPRKVLILVTDGLNDYPTDNYSAMDPTKCQLFKDMGYTVYVLYTTYYPIMHFSYLSNIHRLPQIVEGTGTASITSNLQQCASSPDDFIEATDETSITQALNTFLIASLKTPAYFTK